MQISKWIVAITLGFANESVKAKSIAETIEHHLCGFKGSAATTAMTAVIESQPQWITIAARSRIQMPRRTKQVINERYVPYREDWRNIGAIGPMGERLFVVADDFATFGTNCGLSRFNFAVRNSFSIFAWPLMSTSVARAIADGLAGFKH